MKAVAAWLLLGNPVCSDAEVHISTEATPRILAGLELVWIMERCYSFQSSHPQLHACDAAGFGPLFGAGIIAALGRRAGTNGGLDLKTSPGTAPHTGPPRLFADPRQRWRLFRDGPPTSSHCGVDDGPSTTCGLCTQGWACRRSLGRWWR